MISSTFEYLKFEVDESVSSTIGILTLNRESKLNALNEGVIAELKIFLEEICTKPLTGLIFTGAGEKAFIAGADITAMCEMSTKEAEEFAFNGQHVTSMLEELRFPVIAAVNGFALGGGLEMALACDFIYATSNAVFALPEVSLGLIPGFGGTQRLAKVVGRNRAKEMIYSGKRIKATQAKELGLVLEISESKDELIDACKKILLMIGKNSPNAVGVTKYVINNGVDLPVSDGLKLEREHFSNIFSSHDMKEGTQAFIEKRAPQFKGE